MLKPSEFNRVCMAFLLTLFFIKNHHAQSGSIFVEDLRNPIGSLTIEGLPENPGFFHLDECGLCLPFGGTRQMINSAKEILNSRSVEEFYDFEEGESYSLKVIPGRRTRYITDFWHIQDVNASRPRAVRLDPEANTPRGTLAYNFRFEEATDGDVLAFSVYEHEVVQEHSTVHEFIIFIPIRSQPKINFDMTADGHLDLEGLGQLTIGGLPKRCDLPIASIIRRDQELSVKAREQMILAMAKAKPVGNMIDADATAINGYQFDFQLHIGSPVEQNRPKVTIGYYHLTSDGSFGKVSIKGVDPEYLSSDNQAAINAKLPFKPEFAATGDVLEIHFRFQPNSTQFGQFPADTRSFYLYLPVQISGKAREQKTVPVLGSTLTPKIPYMVLHDPPGDGSFSTFEAGNTFCRATSISLANSIGTNVNAAVKLGVAGSAGFIVTTDFEFSTTFSAGLELSTTEISDNSYETCLTVTETIQTSNLDEVGEGFRDGDDLFVGYGTEMLYGVFDNGLVYDEGCRLVQDKVLVFAPTDNQQQFILTERGIREDMARLEELIVNTNDNKARAEAENQMDVWEQVIALNRENKADDSELIKSFNLSGGNVFSVSEELITTIAKSIETEVFIETTAGVEFLLEAGGSGVSGGFELSTSQTFGVSTQGSQESRKLISYQLFDDDTDNRFSIDVFRDPMYGSPYFRLRDGSRTSCPFEGGTRMDAPRLYNGADCSDQSKFLDIVNAPTGEPVFAPLKICNESSFERSYTVRLDGQTNRLGAIFELNGRNLNDISEGQVFRLAPNTCITALLQIWGNPKLPRQLEYNDIVLFIRPGDGSCNNDCDDEGVEDAIVVNVQFSDRGNINFCGDENATEPGVFFDSVQDDGPLRSGRPADDAPEVQAQPTTTLTLLPNPTKDFVNIHYQLPNAGVTTLSIVDINGTVWQQVVDGQMKPAGKHAVGVQNLDLPAGTYLVRLQTGADVKVEPLIVIKG